MQKLKDEISERKLQIRVLLELILFKANSFYPYFLIIILSFIDLFIFYFLGSLANRFYYVNMNCYAIIEFIMRVWD